MQIIKKVIGISSIILAAVLILSAPGCHMPDAAVSAEETPAASVSSTPEPAPTPIPEPTPRQPYVFDPENPDYREAMRQWVVDIGAAARERDEGFLLIPQNCEPLFTYSGDPDGVPTDFFLDAINGVGREDLSYGYYEYGARRPDDYRESIIERLNVAADWDLPILTIDYCRHPNQIAFADQVNQQYGYIGYCSPNLELTKIPKNPLYENADDIHTLSDAKNFLCIFNPGAYRTRADFVYALSLTNYDILLIDAVFDLNDRITAEDVEALRTKANGGQRLVISYLSIGEAESYRDYWDDDWNDHPPEWLKDENPNWANNYIVEYWNKDWQNIIAFNDDSSLNRILDSGFDGVYLDIVDGYETFEE